MPNEDCGCQDCLCEFHLFDTGNYATLYLQGAAGGSRGCPENNVGSGEPSADTAS
jgi:hypothetical protein